MFRNKHDNVTHCCLIEPVEAFLCEHYIHMCSLPLNIFVPPKHAKLAVDVESSMHHKAELSDKKPLTYQNDMHHLFVLGFPCVH